MRTSLLTLFILVFTHQLLAQKDSLGNFDIFRNNSQASLNPALASDMGKHIIRFDGQFQHSIINSSNSFNQWQSSYTTQWRNHGFGLYTQNIPSSQLIWSNTIGLQYAYAFKVGKSTFWQNTKIGLGVGLGVTQNQTNNKNLLFNDQINQNGIVRPTGEPLINEKSYNLNVNIGLFIRSKKMYLQSTFSDINQPNSNIYQSPYIPKIGIQTQGGVKLYEQKKIALWVIAGIGNNDENIGLSATYKHFIASYTFGKTNNGANINTFQASYYSPRLRVYAQYERMSNMIYYTNFGMIATGIAIGINKQ